jgi:hypothetical protein
MQMKTGLTRLTGLKISGMNPVNFVNPVSKNLADGCPTWI